MRVLVACEFSGTVGAAFGRRGHEVVTVDLLPTEGDATFYRHIQGDVLEVLAHPHEHFSGPIELLVAHPPCTFLTNAGARWLYEPGTRTKVAARWAGMDEGAAFFRALWSADVPRIAVENPVMMGHAKELTGAGNPTQTVQPWWFGHHEVKSTCLWLKGLPKLVPTDNVKDAMLAATTYAQRAKVHHASPHPDRWKKRSLTLPGLAQAMAEQWGERH
jgi:hypothetical protein